MSVIKSKRHLSKLEYCKHFNVFYMEFVEKCRTIAKRRRFLVTKQLGEVFTSVLNDMSILAFQKFPKATKEHEQRTVALHAIETIISSDEYLISFFLYGQFKRDQRNRWIDLLNRQIDVLCELFNVEYNGRLEYYDMEQAYKLDAFRLAVELQQEIHSKAIRLPRQNKDSYTMWFIDCIDKAVYHIYHANRIYPNTKKQLRVRTDHLYAAKSRLEASQQPMLYFLNMTGYSENTIRRLFDSLVACLKKVSAVINSDKKRFKFD